LSYKFLLTPTFEKQIKRFLKKYPHIIDDLDNFKKDFLTGRVKSNAIPGCGGKIYKTRIKSTDITKGKRGGYRLIYYLEKDIIIFLTIYVKPEKKDITAKEIKTILKEIGLEI